MADILIVDDEPSARMTLALLLRKRGQLVHQRTANFLSIQSLISRGKVCPGRTAATS